MLIGACDPMVRPVRLLRTRTAGSTANPNPNRNRNRNPNPNPQDKDGWFYPGALLPERCAPGYVRSVLFVGLD